MTKPTMRSFFSEAFVWPPQESTLAHFDIIIVGPGLHGDGTACHTQAHCPGRPVKAA